jgi:hypothetical protein
MIFDVLPIRTYDEKKKKLEVFETNRGRGIELV